MLYFLKDSWRKCRSKIEKFGSKYNLDDFFGITMIIPPLVFLLFLMVLPMVWVLYYSFFEVSIAAGPGQGTFVGFNNYIKLLSSPEIYHAIWVGVVFAVSTTSFQVIIGLVLALSLNRNFRGSSLARTISIMPYLIPVISVVLMWRYIGNPTSGLANYYPISFGWMDDPVAYFGSPDFAMPALIIGASWKYIAFCLLVFLARLQSIDETLYEQAKVSGANIWQMFRTITLPNLRSAILLVVFLRLIWMFNKFGIVWLFTRGGPLDLTTTYPIFLYEETFLNFNLGMGSSGAIILFTFLAASSVVYFWYFKPSKEIETR